MDRRDYILRMIEQLGHVLLAIRNRILGREIERPQLQEALSDAARQGGLDLDLARAMSPETLMMMVAPGGEVDPGRCWLLAEIFYLEGLEAELAGLVAEARSSLERAGFLFGLLEPVAGNLAGVAEAEERLAEIERRLEKLPGRKMRALAPR
ncbi:MAG: hypothetical protein R3266_07785 [Gemmatimonadota bacterium]|nr:hypothetical protein [Gemmatimonadota bacterium]